MQYSRELEFRRAVPYFGIGGRAMKRMSKSEASRKVKEANAKIFKVYAAMNNRYISPAQFLKISDMLNKLEDKIKRM